MKNNSISVFIMALMLLIFTGNTYAQSINTDSALSDRVLMASRLNYTRLIGDQSRLLNGIKYVEYKPGYVGNAYYLSGGFQNAYLRYDDADFYNMPVLFDLYKNMIVVNHAEDGGLMSLLNSKLDEFIIADHTFISIVADSTHTTLKTGFYELLYNGHTRLLAKYSKDIQEEKSGNTLENIFDEHTNYYLRKGNNYYPVSGRRSMLDLLKDKKKILETYIKLNKIDFSADVEAAMAKVALYYDQLNK